MLSRAIILLAAWLAGGTVHAEALPLSSCAAPVYSPEATRYELQGTTVLALSVGDDGRAANVSVAASSGSKLLDAASVKLAASCRFAKTSAAATLDVPWVLPPGAQATQRPLPVAGSCGASKLFKPVDAGAADANMLARVQVWEDGQVYSPKIETGSGNEQIDRRALALIQACRYTPAQRDGKPVAGNAVIHLAFAKDMLEEPALRALYQRYLPAMQRQLQGRKEYRSAHILLKTEAAAREALAKINGGEAFAQVALVSLDRAGKDGGDLGWSLPEYFTPTFAAALRARTEPGLLPEPVKTEFGWHVIRIDGIRPAEPRSFESVRAALWKAALAEKNVPG